MTDFTKGILIGAVVGVITLGLCVIISIIGLGWNILVVR